MATTQLGSQSVKLDKVRASDVDKVATCGYTTHSIELLKLVGRVYSDV